ncbi:MAG: hypothetical protein F6K58_13320 [Symploca sp. SIO2E9]|nr:hypothetical protein [Symploca sp. SIO2E9]
MDRDYTLKNFVNLSAILTGYSSDRIMPAIDPIGLAKQYLDYLQNEQTDVDESLINQLFTTFIGIADQPRISPEKLAQEVGKKILKDADVGPIARRIIRLWYLGVWYKNEPPKSFEDGTVISMNAYIRGLSWDAIQAHPMGYSEMRYGYWANPPQLSLISALES